MLDKKTIKTLYLIPELDQEKAKNNPSTEESEIQPDESTFGSKETCRAAFHTVQVASHLADEAIKQSRAVRF